MTDSVIDREILDRPVSNGTVHDYVALLKPRVMSLVVFSGFAGMVWRPVICIRCWPWSRCCVSPWRRVPPVPSICGMTAISTP